MGEAREVGEQAGDEERGACACCAGCGGSGAEGIERAKGGFMQALTGDGIRNWEDRVHVRWCVMSKKKRPEVEIASER